MNESQLEAIMQRLDRLERHNKLLTRWGIVGLASLSMLAACAATYAERFPDALQVVDGRGQIRHNLYVNLKNLGESGLQLRDVNGKLRIEFLVRAIDGDAVVNLCDKQGNPRASIGVSGEGEPYADVYDANRNRTRRDWNELVRR